MPSSATSGSTRMGSPTYTLTWEVAAWAPSSSPPAVGTNDIRRLQFALQTNGGFLFTGDAEESRLIASINTSTNEALLEYVNTSGGNFLPTLTSPLSDFGEFDGDTDGFTVTLVLDASGYRLTTVGLDAPNQADVTGTWVDLGTTFETVLGTDGPMRMAAYVQDLAITGATLDIDRITLVSGTESDILALKDFTYDPATGDSQISIEGAASTAYVLIEADDLDFETPDQSPIPLSGATVGTLSGDQVITDGDGNATVQFNLGTSKATPPSSGPRMPRNEALPGEIGGFMTRQNLRFVRRLASVIALGTSGAASASSIGINFIGGSLEPPNSNRGGLVVNGLAASDMTGVERTYPNALTREYCHVQQDARRTFTPGAFLTMAMVNALAGPMDQNNGAYGLDGINQGERRYGPLVQENFNSTVTSETARVLVIFSGFDVLPDAPEEYEKKGDRGSA